jgi:hypothetical protein
MQQALPVGIQNKIREYPFTKAPNQPRPKRGPLDTAARSKIIRSKLRLDIMLLDADFEFMSNPEHARWLKDHAENKLGLKFESLAKSHKGQRWSG